MPARWHGIPLRTLKYGEWAIIGRKLGGISRCSQWWLGDWVRYGAARWGERYIVAAKITGYDAHSLKNMAWIASRFEPSRRCDGLTWSHHAAVAPLDLDLQDIWLDRAIAERLSVADLRIELRSAQDRHAVAPESEPKSAHASLHVGSVVCPRCGLEISHVDHGSRGVSVPNG